MSKEIMQIYIGPGYPKIGGISTYCERLAASDMGRGRVVFTNRSRYRTYSDYIWSIFRSFVQILFFSTTEVHLHRSRFKLDIFVFLGAVRKVSIYYHHGAIDIDCFCTRVWLFALRWVNKLGCGSLRVYVVDPNVCRYLADNEIAVHNFVPYIEPQFSREPSVTKVFSIIWCGQEIESYGAADLLDAMSKYNDSTSIPTIGMFFYGTIDSEYSKVVRKRIQDMGFIDCFYNTGEHDYLMHLQLSSIFIRTTRIDSFGISIMDALAAGCKVICTDIPGRPQACITYSVGDSQELFLKIQEASGNSIDSRINNAEFNIALSRE